MENADIETDPAKPQSDDEEGAYYSQDEGEVPEASSGLVVKENSPKVCPEEEGKLKEAEPDTHTVSPQEESQPPITKSKVDLEDGELEDGQLEEEAERTQKPRPLCRFFAVGSCHWGVSCRFVHPGINDKGNYMMLKPPGLYPSPQSRSLLMAAAGFDPYLPSGIPDLDGTAFLGTGQRPMVEKKESAWEIALRRAKEAKKKDHRTEPEPASMPPSRLRIDAPAPIVLDDYSRQLAGRHSLGTQEREVSSRRRRSVSPEWKRRQMSGAPVLENPRRMDTTRVANVSGRPDWSGPLAKGRAPRDLVTVVGSEEWRDPWMRNPNTQSRLRVASDSSQSAASSDSDDDSRRFGRSGRNAPAGGSGVSRMEPAQIYGHRDSAVGHHQSPALIDRARENSTQARNTTDDRGRSSTGTKQDPAARRYDAPTTKPTKPTRSKQAASSSNDDGSGSESSSSSSSSSSKSHSESKDSRSSSSNSSSSSSSSSGSNSNSRSQSSSDSSDVDEAANIGSSLSAKLASSKPGSSLVSKLTSNQISKPLSLTESATTAASLKRPAASSSISAKREDLLKELRAVEDAIQRKKMRTN